MNAYDSLSTFPDVQPALAELGTLPTVTTVVFSNGTQSMVSNSVHRSPDLSPHASVFADLVSVEDVKQFKPAPTTYLHLAEKVSKSSSQLGDIWLVSGNPFDIVGARSVGLNAIWVDRNGRGWVDAAMPSLRPTVVVKNLGEILGVIKAT
jgi:2-haloacid dehalogenase